MTFARTLPLQFFYLDNFSYFLGGGPLLYLGIYGYGTDVSDIHERAFRLAIYDGMQMLAQVIGLSISAPINEKWGNHGNYVVSTCLLFLAFLHVLLFIKETR